MQIVVAIESLPTEYWRAVEVPGVVRITDDGGLRTYSLDAAYAFEQEQTNVKQLQMQYIALLKDLAAKDIELLAVEFCQDDFTQLGEELKEIDETKRIVRLLKELELAGAHFKFRTATLKAWKGPVKEEAEDEEEEPSGRYIRELQHPYYYKDDLRLLKNLGLRIKIKKKLLRKLDRLAEEEAETARTIYFRPALDGYYVFVHELRSELFRDLEKQAVVQYNRKRGRGKYVVEELFCGNHTRHKKVKRKNPADEKNPEKQKVSRFFPRIRPV